MPGVIQEIELQAAPGKWRLSRAEPAPDLVGLVTEYWEVEGTLDAFRETLLPNGSVELMVNLGPSHRVLSDQGSGMWDRAWYSGLQERSLVIESMQGTHLVSARLHPLGAAELLGKPVAQLANSVVDLELLLGNEGRRLRERVVAADAPAARFEMLEAFLRQGRTATLAAPDFVRVAATRIEQLHGNLRVATLHEELGISRKHLAVSFTRHLGVPAKAYARILRFVWTLGRLRESATVDWSKLAGEAGYSDQSHLVRDFRRIGAESPTEYLRRWDPGGTALLYEAG
jgi:AraC-like DNA-binding protein